MRTAWRIAATGSTSRKPLFAVLTGCRLSFRRATHERLEAPRIHYPQAPRSVTGVIEGRQYYSDNEARCGLSAYRRKWRYFA
jgi:hypothetical protein